MKSKKGNRTASRPMQTMNTTLIIHAVENLISPYFAIFVYCLPAISPIIQYNLTWIGYWLGLIFEHSTQNPQKWITSDLNIFVQYKLKMFPKRLDPQERNTSDQNNNHALRSVESQCHFSDYPVLHDMENGLTLGLNLIFEHFTQDPKKFTSDLEIFWNVN